MLVFIAAGLPVMEFQAATFTRWLRQSLFTAQACCWGV
jgi:hypothetical protein